MQTGGFGCPSFLSYGCYRSVTELCKYLIIIYYKPIIRSIFYCESVLAADFFVAQKGEGGWEFVFKRVEKEAAVKCR